MYFLHETFFKRLHKNKVQEAVGWDDKMIQWCLKEATAKGLREWGGLALDKIEDSGTCTIVYHIPRQTLFFGTFCIDHASFYFCQVLGVKCLVVNGDLNRKFNSVYNIHTGYYMFHIICFILYVSLHLQENLEMTVKNGKHKLVGLVNLGGVHTVMKTLSGNVIFNSYNIARIH